MRQLLIVCVTAIVALAGGRLAAAEIQLRGQCQPRGAVVLLGDVAQVFAHDRDRAADLEQIELFPTPSVGTKRFLRSREVQDLLELRGVSLAGHTLSGSSMVTIVPETAAPTVRPERGPTTSQVRQAVQLVKDAVVRRLEEQAPTGGPWIVEVQFEEANIPRLLAGTSAIAISGGRAPWTGPQQFVAQLGGGENKVEFVIKAEVSAPPTVVVAVRALPRGAVIQASDVQLDRAGPQVGKAERLLRVEDAIGRETTQAIAVGRPLDRAAVRQPLVVRKGEVVTVYVRSPGVQLKTTARARDNGSQGELIEVESLLDRKSYFARVRGIQEVEVYARAASAEESAVSGQ